MEFVKEETEIIKYPGITFNQEYRIDKEGNVWSPYRGWHLQSKQKIAKGYLRVKLMTSDNKLGRLFMVHRLVLNTFNPIENSEELQVNHIDGNKENNKLENLEWCNQFQNIQHSVKIGLRNNMPKGENASCVKLKEQEVLEICELLKNSSMSLAEIGNLYNVSKHTIFDIKRKKSWKWLTKNYNFD